MPRRPTHRALAGTPLSFAAGCALLGAVACWTSEPEVQVDRAAQGPPEHVEGSASEPAIVPEGGASSRPRSAPVADRSVRLPKSPAQGGHEPSIAPRPAATSPSGKTVRELLADPLALADAARVEPHTDGRGGFDGLQVHDVQPGGVAHDLGLRSGDVVQSANGMPLRSLDQALAAYQALSEPTVDQVRFRVQRGGVPVDLVVQLDAVPGR